MNNSIVPLVGEDCQPREAALEWARCGYRVFLLSAGTKIPLRGSHGLHDATNDEEEIRARFREHPDANYGVPMGRVNGLVLVDADTYKTEYDPANLAVDLPRTFTVRSARGGKHHIYLAPDDVLISSQEGFVPAVDCKGEGGYLVGPGSRTRDGVYAVVDPAPFAPLPRELYERYPKLVKRLETTRTASFWVDKYVARAVSEGNRNRNGFDLALQLRDNHIAWGDATELMQSYWSRVKDTGPQNPPYRLEDAYASLKQAYGEPAREPARGAKSSQIGTTYTLPDLTDEVLTDVGNADRFAAEYGDRLKHCSSLGWVAYDGKRWVRGGEKQAQEWAKQCLRDMWKQAQELEDSRFEREVMGHVHRSMSAYHIKSMLTLASSDARMSANVDDFDTQPHLLNIQNGTLDLLDGSLREHRAADRITHLAPVKWDPDAEAPRFLRFLEEIFPGDAELVAYLQRFIGYTVTGEVREEKWVYASGAGSNGKGVLIRALAFVLGDYATPIAADVLTKSKHHDGGERATPALATLPGKRFVYAQEPTGDALDEGKLKELVSPDEKYASPKHKDPFHFKPTFTLWLAANKRLKVDDTSNAVWRRTVPVDFTESFTGREDWTLEPTLQAEASGILTWIVAGAKLWYGQGLGDLPMAVAETKKEYRAEQDPANVFFEECLVPDASSSVPLSEAAEAYTAWWGSHSWAIQIDPKNLRAFAKLARDHGVTVRKVGKNNVTALVGYRRRTGRTVEPQTLQGENYRDFGESQFAEFATAEEREKEEVDACPF